MNNVIAVNNAEEIRTEIIRKGIHVLIALVPTIASISLLFTYFVLLTGMLVFSFAEYVRLNGGSVILISRLTLIASRRRDNGRFVFGPVTLAIGALLALSLYPSSAAAIAIYALAFGDSISSIAGKLFGSLKIPFTNGKTVVGSAACFMVVMFIAFVFTENLSSAIIIGATAAAIEAFSTNDLDNIIIPIGTGAVAALLM